MRACEAPAIGLEARARLAALLHALDNALTVVDLEPDVDPLKALAIGPDSSEILLEVIWVELDLGVELVIHAMPLRQRFYDLLPDPGDTT